MPRSETVTVFAVLLQFHTIQQGHFARIASRSGCDGKIRNTKKTIATPVGSRTRRPKNVPSANLAGGKLGTIRLDGAESEE
jgi:hypothetical protein